MTRRYTVVYDRTDLNYSAYVPMLPIILVTTHSLAKLETLARECIADRLADQGRAGEPFDVDLVADADYDGDMLTIDGRLIPARDPNEPRE